MRRLVYFGSSQESLLDVLRKESPQLDVCATLEELVAVLTQSSPQILVIELSSNASFDDIYPTVERNTAGVPLVFVSHTALEAPLRAKILDALNERGTLLAPVDAGSFRATIRSWLSPATEPALMDSNALVRIYSAGGRALADRLLSAFVSSSAATVERAKRLYLEKQAQQFVTTLEGLEQQAGSLGAVDVQESVEEVLDEFGEKACVSAELWLQLERSVQSAVRVLSEQTRQDRTV